MLAGGPASVCLEGFSQVTDAQALQAASTEPFVEMRGVRKSYDGRTFVVDDLNLSIARGEFLTLLGPSGSGKTTTLMMLAGFERLTAGTITIDGRPIEDQPPHRRNFGVVFQSYALFPHMTVFDNVAFPLSVRGLGKPDVATRVTRALQMVELAGLESRRPGQLSGGQQQRVALARALVFEPSLVLMDEPLGALDKRLREQMQIEIKHLHRDLGITIVYVTHDQTEAMVLSDRVAIFHEGRIQQLGAPREIHENPANGFVARFVGETNALQGEVVSVDSNGACEVRLAGGAVVRGVSSAPRSVGARVLVAVRPERIRVGNLDPSLENRIRGRVAETVYLGDRLVLRTAIDGGDLLLSNLEGEALDAPPSVGDVVELGWRRQNCLVLDLD